MEAGVGITAGGDPCEEVGVRTEDSEDNLLTWCVSSLVSKLEGFVMRLDKTLTALSAVNATRQFYLYTQVFLRTTQNSPVLGFLSDLRRDNKTSSSFLI